LHPHACAQSLIWCHPELTFACHLELVFACHLELVFACHPGLDQGSIAPYRRLQRAAQQDGSRVFARDDKNTVVPVWLLTVIL
jgi:hypothetical protein